MQRLIGQGMNYLLRLTAPPGRWPWQAHARGVAAHIAYGAALGPTLAAGTDN